MSTTSSIPSGSSDYSQSVPDSRSVPTPVVKNAPKSNSLFDPQPIEKAKAILQKIKIKDKNFESLKSNLSTFLESIKVPDTKQRIHLTNSQKKEIEQLKNQIKTELNTIQSSSNIKQLKNDIIKAFENLSKGIVYTHYGDPPIIPLIAGGTIRTVMKYANLDGSMSTDERIEKILKIINSSSSRNKYEYKDKVERAINKTYRDIVKLFWKCIHLSSKLPTLCKRKTGSENPVLFKRYHKMALEYLVDVGLYNPPKTEYKCNMKTNPFTRKYRPIVYKNFSDYEKDQKEAIVRFIFSTQNRKENPRSSDQKKRDAQFGKQAQQKSYRGKQGSPKSASDTESQSKIKELIRKGTKRTASNNQKLKGYFMYGRKLGIVPKDVSMSDFLENPSDYLIALLEYKETEPDKRGKTRSPQKRGQARSPQKRGQARSPQKRGQARDKYSSDTEISSEPSRCIRRVGVVRGGKKNNSTPSSSESSTPQREIKKSKKNNKKSESSSSSSTKSTSSE